MERRLAAIFALDMVGYSRLMESDEADTLRRQESLRADLIDPTISGHHGRVVKGTGDGLLAEFASAVDAVECAAEIQRGMVEREADVPREGRIEFRIGINVGDIVARDGDIFGDGVNVAARIESLADPGGILVSGTAYNQILNKVKLGFEDLGSQMVKNLERPVKVYRVLLDPAGADARSGRSSRRPTMRQLLRRRVPQLVGLYLLSGWAVLEFVDWAVRQYSLSPTISSFVVALLLLLLPSVLWLAWRHGAPGPDGWGKADGTAILANLVVAAAILGFTFGGEELGAATTTKVLENEEGKQVERTVPKESLVRKVQIVGLDNESGDPELDWLSLGIPVAVGLDLDQDPFVRVVGPVEESSSVIRGLEMAGYTTPYTAVPLSLLRDLAERSGVERFLVGEFQKNGDTLVVETRLHETANARLVATRSYRAGDPLELADQISLDLRRDLGVPEWQVESAVDLPVSELLTSSPAAFRLYVSAAGRIWSYTGEVEAALEDLERALEYDSTSAELFAMAGGISWFLGDMEAARGLLAKAMKRSYQLSERHRLELRSFYQEVIEQDLAGAVRTAHYWAELYPDDPKPWRVLSLIHRDSGDTESQIEALRAMIAIDPSDPDALRSIAGALRSAGAHDSTLAYLRRVQERWPSDADAYNEAAKLLADLGRQAEAYEALEQAHLVAPEDGTAERYITVLDIRNGRFGEAAERLERLAMAPSVGALAHWQLSAEMVLAYETGRFSLLEELYSQFVEVALETFAVLPLVFGVPYHEFLQFAVEGGRGDEALRELDRLRALVDPPNSHAVDVAAARVHVDLNDLDAARRSLARLEELIAVRNDGWVSLFHVDWHRARIAWGEDGNCDRAIGSFDAAVAEARSSETGTVMYDPLIARLSTERAACLRSLGRLEPAETAIDGALMRFPGSAMLRVEAASLYAAQGRPDDAVAELERALETWAEADPEYVPAREAREFLQELQAG